MYENKKLTSAFSTVTLDKPGSDCRTKLTLKILLTEDNINDYMYRYIIDKDKLVMIDDTNKSTYINKLVNMRSVLYCNGKTFCNKCAGELYYKLGIKNFGLTAGTIGSRIMME